ncbi:uroporphyrinogen-III C-methyltransferase [Oceanirhabdus seepicola]|uniref:uroporphyrinogen-III C-methyltransferase n=1 Tax=Oceanirhabdus seepicola TaxID=2828781 RepID=A0A9J6P036_9CLOT|nr:uroporphyrinogen-III C-methyltransferase [Oceanirhabdus seepicola]MCM1990042.1 uroporphyrinogen-III C-methyltransferase [Oceanirhabdus seepicola]
MKGKVFLVGAGPGDFGLITLKGLQCIRKADVLVYDRLANEEFLKETKEGCEYIYVGKKSSEHTKTQDEINEIIFKKAQEGKIVTRLKGGDPYVFGRGGEEGEYLYDRDIKFEVIPGISSSIGGLAYAGIPITHRNYASSFHVITGHLKDDNQELNWKALSEVNGTLVFLMGMSNLEKITESLIENGKDKNTAVAIVNWATRPEQRVVQGELHNIVEIVKKDGIGSPSVIVVGNVATLRDKLNFFEDKPLFGKNIVITRSRAQSSSLVKSIEELGGRAVEMPAIKIRKIENNKKLEKSIENLKDYDYIVFTSTNGVDIFFEELFQKGFDSRALGNCKIAAIGKGTEERLSTFGLRADIVPERAIGEALLEELSNVVDSNSNVLIPRAEGARRLIVEELSKVCKVEEVITYTTVKDCPNKDELLSKLKENKVDYITFTSSSTVKNFIEIIGDENIGLLDNVKCISIGPITSKTAKELGVKIYREAEESSIEGVLETIINEEE